jgi:hypothetical protein
LVSFKSYGAAIKAGLSLHILLNQVVKDSCVNDSIMSITNLARELRTQLSPKAIILDDRDSADFKAALVRWSDVDLQVPAAIIKPATEDDIVVTVSPTL